jgi:hypothetical protein
LGERLHSSDDEVAWNDRHGEGFRTPANAGARLGTGRRTETAHARTRGPDAMAYGDFRFCLAVVMAGSTRR